jgi:hypothetical protein
MAYNLVWIVVPFIIGLATGLLGAWLYGRRRAEGLEHAPQGQQLRLPERQVPPTEPQASLPELQVRLQDREATIARMRVQMGQCKETIRKLMIQIESQDRLISQLQSAVVRGTVRFSV